MPINGPMSAGEAWQLTDGESEDETPVFSPGGDSVAFIRRDDIWVSAVKPGAEPRRVTTGAEIHYTTWDADGRSLLATGMFGSSDLELCTVHPESGAIEPWKPRVLLGGRNLPGIIGLSRDGRYLAVDYEETKGNLWAVETSGRRP
jgi:tricorn protease-like protein